MRTICAWCVFVLLVGANAFAQQSTRDPRTFRTDVEAVDIDVRVVDALGQPVAGLSADDFELFESGVRQPIRVFTPIRVPDVPRRRDDRAEADVQTNRIPFEGRLYVFVLDDLHTHPLRSNRTKAVVRLFLDRFFGANDLAAIVTTSGRAETVQELTSSRAALLRALDAFHGSKLRSSTLERIGEYYRLQHVNALEDSQRRNDQRINDPLEAERAHQARQAMISVRDIGRWLESVPARRKALIFVSEGIDYDLRNLIENRFASGVLADVQDAIARAQRGNATIYTIDPRGLGGIEDETIEISSLPDDTTGLGTAAFLDALRWTQDSLRILAEETGGFALVNTNDLQGGLARLVRENSEYYVLGYQPTDTRRDGRFRRVEVRVKRPGLRVLTRRGYYAAKADERTPDTTLAGSPSMRALIDSPVPVSGLPLQTTVTAFRGLKDKASVLVTAEIDPAFTLTEKDGLYRGRVELTTVAVTMGGRIVASDHRGVDLNLRPATRDSVLRHGIRTMARLELPPGRYQVRIAARDAHGTLAGSVLHDLVIAPFEKAPVTMSDVLLASRAAMQTATTNTDPALTGVLTEPPTVARTFDRGDILTAFAELYDNRKDQAVPIALTTAVVDTAGRVVYRSEETVEAFSFEPARRAYRHTVSIPLKDLSAADYTLRISAKPRHGTAREAVREVPFAIRSDRTVAD
jgi:VWFA-related protein